MANFDFRVQIGLKRAKFESFVTKKGYFALWVGL